MPLTQKLVLAFLLVTVVPLGVIIWVSHHTVVEQAERQIGTQLEDSVMQVGKRMDEFMLNRTSALKSLVIDPNLSSANPELIGNQLSSFIYSFPDFNEVLLADTHGKVTASSYKSNVGKSLFGLFENTQDEFELACLGSPGSVYFSGVTNVPGRLRQAASQGRLDTPSDDWLHQPVELQRQCRRRLAVDKSRLLRRNHEAGDRNI